MYILIISLVDCLSLDQQRQKEEAALAMDQPIAAPTRLTTFGTSSRVGTNTEQPHTYTSPPSAMMILNTGSSGSSTENNDDGVSR